MGVDVTTQFPSEVTETDVDSCAMDTALSTVVLSHDNVPVNINPTSNSGGVDEAVQKMTARLSYLSIYSGSYNDQSFVKKAHHFEEDTNGTEDQVKRQIPSQETVSLVQQVVGPPSQPIPSQQPSTSTLSTAWDREEKIRKSGQSKGRVDVYYKSPDGIRHRSTIDIQKYFTEEGIQYEPVFNFKPLGTITEVPNEGESENTQDLPSQAEYMSMASKIQAYNTIKCFDIVDLGPLTTLLGVEFERKSEHSIIMHQRPYIKKLLEENGLENTVKVTVPVPVGTTIECTKDNSELDKNFPYRALVGSLLFIAGRTRPDIPFSVIVLSQYSNAFGIKHVNLLKQVLRYLWSTIDYGIDLGACRDDAIRQGLHRKCDNPPLDGARSRDRFKLALLLGNGADDTGRAGKTASKERKGLQ
uniref:MBD domain-containing protein n=1 Tax=Strigamia maritima TaxID=126957 RepID=T1IN31_STRMM